MIGVLVSLAYIVGNQFAGRAANSYGRKRLAFISLLVGGFLLVVLAYSRIFWVAGVLFGFIAIFGGVRDTAMNSLTLDQIPLVRGTLMSLNSAAQSLGTAVGIAIGGYVLITQGYSSQYLVFGLMFILGGLVTAFLTSEPA